MPESPQTIEQLQKRFQQFSNLKIKVQTQRDHAKSELEQLKSEALEKFGSDDLEVLKSKLDEMKQSNEQKRVDYQKQLDEIEEKLSLIEDHFADAETNEG